MHCADLKSTVFRYAGWLHARFIRIGSTDHASGAKDDRLGLNQALTFVRPGDVLVVWKLDRLGRSLSHC
jgi:DNA invertase Pin-like site-specific DNA recombinase